MYTLLAPPPADPDPPASAEPARRRRRPRARSAAGAVVVAAVAVLAACGDPDATGPTTPERADDGVAVDTTAPGEPAPDDAALDTSPLLRLVGHDEGVSAEAQRERVALEQAIAECMLSRGWTYQPAVPADADASIRTDGRTPEEVAVAFGYGVVDSYRRYGSTGAGPAAGAEDPNAPYVESLSEAQRDAYAADLDGGESDEAATNCRRQAQIEVRGPAATDTAFVEATLAAYAASARDPRVVATVDAWIACMGGALVDLRAGDQGPVRTPDDMVAAVSNLIDAAAGVTVRDDGDESVERVGEVQPLTPEVLDDLQARELSLHEQDQRCQREVGYRTTRHAVELEAVETLYDAFPEYRS